MKIAIASKNPVKIEAARIAAKQVFPDDDIVFESFDAQSGVSEQPFGDEEIFLGAKNRADGAMQNIPDADYSIGIEGGMLPTGNEFEEYTWVVIRSKEGKYGKAKSATFLLPGEIAELIKGGLDFGEASDRFFKTEGLRSKNGTVGMLTGDAVTRTTLYTEPIILAFIPFRNPEFYK